MRAYEVAAVAGALIIAAATSARASELVWEGEPGCEQQGQLSFELERALGRPLAAAGELLFHVAIERTSGPVTARLRATDRAVEGASDERVLAAPTCAELIDTLAVAITLAIGGAESSNGGLDASVAASASPAAEPPPMQDADAGQAMPAAKGAGPRWGAVALLVADVGSLPHGALGAGLGLELSWTRLRLQAGALMFYPQRAEWGASSDVNAELALTLGATRVCTPLVDVPSRFLSFPACLGLELGRMEGVGHGLPTTRSRAVLWMAPRVEAGVAWTPPRTRLSLEVSLSAVMPLNRDEFMFDDIGTVHQPARVAGRLGASLSLAVE